MRERSAPRHTELELEQLDDIAAASETPIPLPASNARHNFMAGLRSDENPLESYSTTLDSQLASTASSTLKTMAITWDRVHLATAGDQDMATLLHIIERGFPQFCHKLPAALQEYYQFRDHLYTVDGVILYKHRIVIPPSLRQHILAVPSQLCSGQASHQPLPLREPTVHPATAWHLPSQEHPPTHQSHRPTPSSASVQISSPTKGCTISLWLTDTPTGQSLNEHKRDPKA